MRQLGWVPAGHGVSFHQQNVAAGVTPCSLDPPPCRCCALLQLAGLYSGTPAALTALADTHLVQLATLPQVLGVLAFVYAGEWLVWVLACVCCLRAALLRAQARV